MRAMNVTQNGRISLSFDHRYSFEGGSWDGGQVRISLNGGAFTTVPASAFSAGGYNGTVLGNSSAENHGQAAFVNTSASHGAGTLNNSVCELGYFSAGDSIRIQFLAANDTNTRGDVPQWEIDNLVVTQGLNDPNVTFSVAATTTGQVLYQRERDNGSGFQPIVGANSAALSETVVAPRM